MDKSNNGVVNLSSNYESSSKINEKLKSRRVADEKAIMNLKSRIPDIENIFDIHGRIGNGTFSTVLLASLKRHSNIPKEQRKLFAIKHLVPTSHPKRIQKELKCLVEIGGVDNVAGIDLCLRRNESVAFVMPYIAHDRFHDYFDKMDTNEIQKYLKNLLIALKRVHSFNIIHRDVKPSNFLYNRKCCTFMLVDFGLAQNVYGGNNDDDNNLTSSSSVTTTTLSIATTTTTTTNNVIGDQKLINDDNDDKSIKNGNRKRKASEATTDQLDDTNHSTKRIKGDDATENHGVKNIKNNLNSNIMNSPFKMPLKQINEITTPKSKLLSSSLLTTTTNCNKLNSPLSRQVKSAILGVTMTPRLEEKFRIRSPFHHHDNSNNVVNSRRQLHHQQHNNPSVTASPAIITTATTPTTRYKMNGGNNRNNLITSSSSSASYKQEHKCYCFGKNQVCNMCIVKKEIPASRAGTPGYRPPEVLLKYIEQTTAVDIWAVGVILISILSGVYPFFQAPDDFLALAEIVTIFGDDAIRRTAFTLGRQVTMSRKCKPLDLRKLCIRLRNRFKLDRTEAVKKYHQQQQNDQLECSNCQQKSYDCLCANSSFQTEPIGDDQFPSSLYNLLERLLEVNPYKRITAEEALNHQFFKEIYS